MIRYTCTAGKIIPSAFSSLSCPSVTCLAKISRTANTLKSPNTIILVNFR